MAQTDVLLTKEPAPQTVPPCELPCKLSEVARNTGAYTSSGLATSGFRTAKYLLEEWFQNCHARYHQAFADRDQSERQRHESQQLAAETQALAQRTQQDSTRRVGERLQDTHGWKSELQREVEALAAETDLLLAQKQRLERALDATEVPFSIATDNLQCRERRQHPNLVRDHVETELLKEAELIRNIQELLKRTIMQAVSQIRLNREHKETCEMDWSDKVEAYNIDETCGRFHSQSTEVQSHPHSTSFQERWAPALPLRLPWLWSLLPFAWGCFPQPGPEALNPEGIRATVCPGDEQVSKTPSSAQRAHSYGAQSPGDRTGWGRGQPPALSGLYSRSRPAEGVRTPPLDGSKLPGAGRGHGVLGRREGRLRGAEEGASEEAVLGTGTPGHEGTRRLVWVWGGGTQASCGRGGTWKQEA
uniref:Tektin n=1 Tax=Callithrix jacchus TaxID=9483 RepID=A0A8I3WRW2_CALJA